MTKSKQRVSIDANKDKISIITNIEVKINENKNNNSNNNEMNYITNLNIRPQSQKKQLPSSNPSPPILNPPVTNNTVLKFNNPPVINLKPLDGTGIFGRQKILHMNNKIIDKITKDVKRKDMETQTEEIFFKM